MEVSPYTYTLLTLAIEEFVTSAKSDVTRPQILRVLHDNLALSATASTLLGLKDSFDNEENPSSTLVQALSPRVNMPYRTLDNANFYRANLRNADFTQSSLRNVNFMGTDLPRGRSLSPPM